MLGGANAGLPGHDGRQVQPPVERERQLAHRAVEGDDGEHAVRAQRRGQHVRGGAEAGERARGRDEHACARGVRTAAEALPRSARNSALARCASVHAGRAMLPSGKRSGMLIATCAPRCVMRGCDFGGLRLLAQRDRVGLVDVAFARPVVDAGGDHVVGHRAAVRCHARSARAHWGTSTELERELQRAADDARLGIVPALRGSVVSGGRAHQAVVVGGTEGSGDVRALAARGMRSASARRCRRRSGNVPWRIMPTMPDTGNSGATRFDSRSMTR